MFDLAHGTTVRNVLNMFISLFLSVVSLYTFVSVDIVVKCFWSYLITFCTCHVEIRLVLSVHTSGCMSWWLKKWYFNLWTWLSQYFFFRRLWTWVDILLFVEFVLFYVYLWLHCQLLLVLLKYMLASQNISLTVTWTTAGVTQIIHLVPELCPFDNSVLYIQLYAR